MPLHHCQKEEEKRKGKVFVYLNFLFGGKIFATQQKRDIKGNC